MNMKIRDSLKRFLRLSHIDPEKGVQPILQDTDVQGFVGEVKAEFERRREDRRAFELQWKLNQNFYLGNQYCDIVAATGEVVDYPLSMEWEMRGVYNQIAPIVETRLSKLSRVHPGMTVRPATPDASDVAAARASTRILKSAFSAHDMLSTGMQATVWAEICGGVFYKSVWQPHAGKALGEIDGELVHEGDIGITIVPYYEMFPASSYVEELQDQDSIIHAKVYTADEIRLRWGIDVAGRDLNVYTLDMSGMSPGGVGYNPGVTQVKNGEMHNSELVLEYFERPNRDFPQGRHAIIVGDVCVHLGILPYKCNKDGRRGYPFAHQKCLVQPGTLWGASLIERLIPVQRDYNAVRNRINEYLARMAIGNIAVEADSLVDDTVLDTGLPPGQILEYKQGSTPPQWMAAQEVPATLLAQVGELFNEFVNISGVSEMSRTGQTPASISSGTALEILKEQDDTRLALTAENLRACYTEIGRQWIRLYRQFVTYPRLSRIVGEDSGDVMTILWSRNDLTSDDIVIDTDNEMTNTPAQRKQMALDLINAGMFTDPDTGRMTRETRAKLLEIFEMGNWESAIDLDERHIARAQRENLELEKEELPRVMSMDDHQLHIIEHTKYALSAEYRRLAAMRPDLASALQRHIEVHKAQGAGQAMAMAGQGLNSQAQPMGAVQQSSIGAQEMSL